MFEQLAYKLLSIAFGAVLAFFATKIDVTPMRSFVHRHLISAVRSNHQPPTFGVRKGPENTKP